MQEVTNFTNKWTVSFHNTQRWVNPLMGYYSSGDPLSNVHLNFETEDAAIRYATKMGWNYQIERYTEKRANYQGRKSYSDGFLPVHVNNKLKKEGVKGGVVQFDHSATNRSSQWVKTLKFHGDGNVISHGGEKEYEGEWAGSNKI